jgi:hypothetical protein
MLLDSPSFQAVRSSPRAAVFAVVEYGRKMENHFDRKQWHTGTRWDRLFGYDAAGRGEATGISARLTQPSLAWATVAAKSAR